MSTEECKAIVRRLYEGINKGDLATVDALVANNFVNHDPSNSEVRNSEDYKHWLTKLCTAFPDVHFTVEDLIAEGDKVVSRFTFRGTHKGEWRGVPPTGKRVTMTGTITNRVASGKIAECWINSDVLGLRQQLGLIPSMG